MKVILKGSIKTTEKCPTTDRPKIRENVEVKLQRAGPYIYFTLADGLEIQLDAEDLVKTMKVI